MAFDPSPISDPTIARDGDMLVLSWRSSAPAGSTFQVYQDRRLIYSGTTASCDLPWPSGPVWIDIGVVPSADATTDFSASLSAGSLERAELTWLGGTYLSPTIAAYRIFASPRAGASVSYTAPVATVPAYDGGIVTDGYGLGGYGLGGWGESAASYAWTSGVLAPGVWQFAVVPVDAAGNQASSPTAVSVTIAGPPNPPAINPATGRRLAYSYNASTRVATLSWLASP